MTRPTPENLERSLTDLTTWHGEAPRLWQKALDTYETERKARAERPLDEVLRKPLSNTVMLALVGCVALALVVGFLLPSLGKARQSARRISPASDLFRQGAVDWAPNDGDSASAASRAAAPSRYVAGEAQRFVAQSMDAPTRSVIQKATIDLQTPDVRAAFAKVAHLISAAGGEFVENSSLTGEGKTAQANLTLRIGAARLSEVLNSLRELGKVESERTTGEDVTSQVVDLEARIRNEQRIEKELLELLDKRNDAPLKDILELRTSLSGVRQTIEQYIAQRDRLNHLVSLASILVVIRAEPEAEKPTPAQSIGAYFTNNISDAWHDGIRYLADSVVWIVSILISGLFWWLAIAIATVTILRYRRRLAARCV